MFVLRRVVQVISIIVLLAFAALGRKSGRNKGTRLVRKTAVVAWQQLQPCQCD